MLGALLRFWGLTRLGLEHFGEGVYTLVGLWPFSSRGPAGMGPGVIAYAPPGFPILVGLAYLVFGVADLFAIAVSNLAGVLTIPAAVWLGMRSFSQGAGVATAAFAALPGQHVAFSRMALTDATLLLTWLVALGTGIRFLECPRLGLALAFGLAQNVRYNGGRTGAIVALTRGLMILKPEPGRRREAARVLGHGLIAAVVSVLVHSRRYRFVEMHSSGYAGLMMHHRNYPGGINPRLPHWRTELAEQVAVSGVLIRGLTRATVDRPLAWLGCLLMDGGGPPSRWRAMRLRVRLTGGTLAARVSASLPWRVASARSPALLMQRKPAGRVLVVGWIVMAALPSYHPTYAGLRLPLHAFGWLIPSILVVELVRGRAADAARTDVGGTAPLALRNLARPGRLALAVAVADSLGLYQGASPRPEPMAGPLGPTDSLRVAAGQDFADCPRPGRSARPHGWLDSGALQAAGRVPSLDGRCAGRARGRPGVPVSPGESSEPGLARFRDRSGDESIRAVARAAFRQPGDFRHVPGLSESAGPARSRSGSGLSSEPPRTAVPAGSHRPPSGLRLEARRLRTTSPAAHALLLPVSTHDAA